ncbi:hypothetical protein [uncultured Algimonas sp.]|uniref:hypothetical protein n=1 Tax=uncultured Algimonas sp. TaxID=1547920 RepID=UPI00260CF89A|nr:hypothetical protein [uncultured Algimonas sp.]
MSFIRLKGTREARNEQRKSISVIFRTIGFGALGVGLWEPLSQRSVDGILLSVPLALISIGMFAFGLRYLAELEDGETND